MAILRILVIVAVILALCDFSLAKRSIKPLSNKALKRGLILQDTRDKISWNPPTLAADSYEPFEEDGEKQCIDVLANDYDYEGNLDKSSLEIYEYPKHGVATINNKGEVCYKPKAQFHGSDIFSYSVCDTNDRCEWAAIRVRVSSVNDAPEVRDDEAVVGEDDYSVTIDVLANDEDVDGLYVNFASLKVVEKPTNGVVTKTSDHKFIYTPNWNQDTRYFGEDAFIYQICDSENPNLCSYGKVTIDVKDKCLACEHCNDLLPTFNYHAKRIQHVFESTVMSDIQIHTQTRLKITLSTIQIQMENCIKEDYKQDDDEIAKRAIKKTANVTNYLLSNTTNIQFINNIASNKLTMKNKKNKSQLANQTTFLHLTYKLSNVEQNYDAMLLSRPECPK